MSRLKQETILSYQEFKISLEPYSYSYILETISIQYNNKRLENIYLYVDNFSINYQSKSNINHLCNNNGSALRYKVAINGAIYCRLNLE